MDKWAAGLIIIAAILIIKPVWGLQQNCYTSCSNYIRGQCVEYTRHCIETDEPDATPLWCYRIWQSQEILRHLL